MTPSELKYHVQNTGSHFFDRESMRFFGDTMSNFGVRATEIKTNWDKSGNWTDNGEIVKVWELYRRRPVKHGLKSSRYFDMVTFKPISPAK